MKSFEIKVQNEIGYDMSISNIVMQFIRNRNLNSLWLILLKIMIAQAKKDEKYANIAGGILAGMVPVSKALKIYFIRKSIVQGMAFPFKGSYGIFKFIKKSAIFGATALVQAFKQGAAYWNWMKNIIVASISTIQLRNKLTKQ